MTMSKKERESLLMGSFEVLKSNFKKNSSEIQNIMQQILDINPSLVIKMWHYLVEDNKKLIAKDKEVYGTTSELTCEMLHKLCDKKAFTNIESDFIEDKMLVNAVFGEAPNSWGSEMMVVASLIKQDKLNQANRILELVFNNKYARKEKSFTESLQELIEQYLLSTQSYGSNAYFTKDAKEYSADVQSLIKTWIDRVDEVGKAKLIVSYIKIC